MILVVQGRDVYILVSNSLNWKLHVDLQSRVDKLIVGLLSCHGIGEFILCSPPLIGMNNILQ